MTTPAAPTPPAEPATGVTAPVAPVAPAIQQSGYAAAFAAQKPELDRIFAEHQALVDPAAPAVDPAAAPVDPNAPPAEAAPTTVELELPGRRPDDPPIIIELPADQVEAVEGMRRLRNGYLRGTEVEAAKQELALERDQLLARQEEFDVDPTSHLERLDTTARAGIALILLSDPDVVRTIGEDVAQLLDPAKAAALQLAIVNTRTKAKAENASELQYRADVRTSKQAAEAIIAALTPEEFDETKANDFRFLAFGDLDRQLKYDQTGRPIPIPANFVPRMLRPRLVAMGMSDAQIDQKLEAWKQGARPPRRSAAPVTVQPAKKPALPTIDQIKAAVAARPSTAAPPGAGAPAVKVPAIPKGTNVKDAIAALRKTLTQPAN